MSDQTGKEEPRSRPTHDWVEIVATVLLALAAVATAWCSYQANRWNGEQTRASSRTNALRIEASRASSLAETQTQLDVATFIAWVEADVSGNGELAEFIVDRFRAEFKPAFGAWIATDPFTNPNAPSTPFAMPEYQLAAAAEAERLDQETEVSSALVRLDIQRSANYVLGVVLFAASLFFAGMSTKLRTPSLRKVLLVVGCALFLGTVAWIATFPVSFSV